MNLLEYEPFKTDKYRIARWEKSYGRNDSRFYTSMVNHYWRYELEKQRTLSENYEPRVHNGCIPAILNSTCN